MGPGLIGSLLVGLNTAKGLSYGLNTPMIGVNHLEGHLLAIFLQKKMQFPFIALIVSGGHTDMYRASDFGQYKLLGRTRDDAAGESFDKVGKMLGLPYPGGPAIEKLAQNGNGKAHKFPRAYLEKGSLDFSFSGLKTAVMLTIQSEQKKGLNKKIKANIAASFQRAVIDTLVAKTINVAKIENINRIVIAGGVGANLLLRHELEYHFDGEIHFPKVELCTDNGVMIAVAGAFRCAEAIDVSEIKATARWSLESLISF